MNSGRVLQGNAAERHLASAACVKNMLNRFAPSWREELAGKPKWQRLTHRTVPGNDFFSRDCTGNGANFLGLWGCDNAFYSPSGGGGSGRNTVSLYLSSQHF